MYLKVKLVGHRYLKLEGSKRLKKKKRLIYKIQDAYRHLSNIAISSGPFFF
jgi:hypothetical protein